MTKCGFIGTYNVALTYLYLWMGVAAGGIAYGGSKCHFENVYGCRDTLPAEDVPMEGWKVHQDSQNSYAFASCSSNCIKYMTLMRGFQSMEPIKWKVNFCYYLSTLDGAPATDVQMRVIACGKNITMTLTPGAWQTESVRFSCLDPFDVGFEIHLGGAQQRLALDEVTVTDIYTKNTGQMCSNIAPSLFELFPLVTAPSVTLPIAADSVTLPIITADPFTPPIPAILVTSPSTAVPVTPPIIPVVETAMYGEEIDLATDSIPPVFTDEETVLRNVSNQLPNKPSASEKTTPLDGSTGSSWFSSIWKFFKDLLGNPLLLAEVLAIATVSICCLTITIHCFIWRKQRKGYRLAKYSVRGQRYLARDLSNSDMLLDMTVHDSSDGEFTPISRSRSSSKAVPPVDKAKLKATKHAADRRATVSNGTSCGSGSGSSDDSNPRPHPRTKSLPNRPPTNYYETIDEVRKHAMQPVQEGDEDDSKSQNQGLVGREPPQPPKFRRTAQSCREKQERRNKKQKKQSKKPKKQAGKEHKNTIPEDDAIPNSTASANGGLVIPVEGHMYDKLGRTSNPQLDHLNGRTRTERFSLNVNATRDPSRKQEQFRPRAYSQDQESLDWNPASPSLAAQNVLIKGGVSGDLNKTQSADDLTYFTLEPNANTQDNLFDQSSLGLYNKGFAGSVDTLQEEMIISKNLTDSFKRTVSYEPKNSRPNSLDIPSTSEIQIPNENRAPAVFIENVADQLSSGIKENELANRTYHTLEPPKLNGQLRSSQSSVETEF